MNKETDTIKGSCEHCGFAYKGTVELNEGAFPQLKCPSCGKHTQNFDSDYEVDRLEKAEGYKFDYKESEFEHLTDVKD